LPSISRKILSGVTNRLIPLKLGKNKRRQEIFGKIFGHQDFKIIFNSALVSKKPVHVLLVGPPGTAKTMFLSDIREHYRESYFVVGSNTTKAGLLNVLFEQSPSLILIDELEKMNRIDQNILLHLMETGIISETKVSKTRQMELLSSVFATANSCKNISEPLLSRFIILNIPEYTHEEFKQIAVARLKEEGIDEKSALMIAQKVWYEFDSKNIRDVLKVGRLANNIHEVENIIEIMKSYSNRR
jgi:Holliday junction DNA helicase RuvB